MSNEFEQPVEPMSRTEDLLRTGTEEPVIAMSRIEKILRGEKIKPQSRIEDLLLKYNPSDILIEKRIEENGTYYATADAADGYYKVVVDTPVIPPTVLEHLVETVSTNGTHTFTPGTGVDGFSDASITVSVAPNVGSKNITQNGNYTASSDNLDGYSNVNVNVTPNVGSKNITENGTYNASSDSLDGYSSVVVDVDEIAPQNSYGVKQLTGLPANIATFNDGEALPLSNLKVGIEPVQDLHGYDSPWAGGAGKNKIPITCDTQTKQGVTYTVYKNEDGAVTKIHVQGTATADHSFSVVDGYNASNPFMIKAGSYWFKGLSDGESAKYDFNLRKQGESSDLVQVTDKKSLELSEDTYFQSCYLFVYRGATVNTDIYPMIWLKSSPNDDFAPYSNICPISGWSEVDLTRTGKNLFSYDLPIRDGYWAPATSFQGSNNIVTKDNAITWQYIRLYVEGLSQITLSGFDVQGGTLCAWLGSKDVNDVISTFNSAEKNGTKTVPQGAKYICLVIYSIKTKAESYPNAQLELGDTPTTYEPYNGNTYTIDLDGTRYGGEVDVVSGVLTVDRAYVDLGTLNYSYYSGNLFTAQISNLKPVPNTRLCNALCSIYVAKQGNDYASIDGSFVAGFNNASTLAIHDSRFTDTTAFKTAMNGVQLVYELATPLTIQLTPTAVKALEGVNNLFADSGQVQELSYLAHVITNLETINITSNGDYTPQLTKGYSQVTVNLPDGTNTEY